MTPVDEGHHPITTVRDGETTSSAICVPRLLSRAVSPQRPAFAEPVWHRRPADAGGAGILPAFMDPNGGRASCPDNDRHRRMENGRYRAQPPQGKRSAPSVRRGATPAATARTAGTEPGRCKGNGRSLTFGDLSDRHRTAKLANWKERWQWNGGHHPQGMMSPLIATDLLTANAGNHTRIAGLWPHPRRPRGRRAVD